MHYADALTKRIQATSPLCVPLDPELGKLPDGIPKDADGVLRFSEGIIDAVKDSAAAVMVGMPHFEAMGWEGMRAFWKTCAYAKENGLVVIADGNRSGVGDACTAYAEAYLHEGSAVDALTVNPYLGEDGIVPFVEKCAESGKGIYVLVKTGNDSSADVQDLPIGDEVVHEHVAQLTESWGMHHIGPETNLSFVGAIVGPAYPEEMKYLRTLMPHIPFLVPMTASMKHGFLPDGTGALALAAEDIAYASKGSDWQEAARRSAERIARDLKELIF